MKKGISLIVLIITIIVIIILAGAVILSLASNNPIQEATEAKFKENVKSYQAELTLWLSKEFVSTDGMLAVKTINATKDKGEYQQLKIQDIITNMSDKQGGYTEDATKFAIKEGVLIFIGENPTEEEWAKEAGIGKDTIPEVIEKVVPFMFEITTKTVNEKFVLPINTIVVPDSAVFDFVVDYGDGTVVSVKSMQDSNREHVYAVPGKYEISITGRCDRFSVYNELFTNNSYDVTKITKLIQWGNIQMNQLDFFKCSNLTFDIARINEKSYTCQVTNMANIFSQTKLTTIPEGIFERTTEVTDLSAGFYNCTALSTIPENLFSKMKQLTTVKSTFSICSSLASIPAKLFENNGEIISFNNTFARCSTIGQIPATLFASAQKANDFSSVFNDCDNLITIPADLFKNNKKATVFTGAFSSCDAITAIPDKLFASNPSATTFINTFASCTKLVSIPDNLFEGSSNVETVRSMFATCYNLTTIPPNLFKDTINIIDFSSVFDICYNLTAIPDTLFKSTTKVQTFQSSFNSCAKITSIPEGLFNYTTKVVNFRETFSGCNKLGSIPNTLFDNTLQVVDFQFTFSNCSNLTGTAPAIWTRSNVTSYKGCFLACSKLSNYSSIPTGWKTQ